ncbi:MAG: superoxide dismutase [Pseudomonadales bacterium]|jgi:Fe-Mn family superoxide dismutase|nr:superoxide dismutase [Pseudomonadales bacterium]
MSQSDQKGAGAAVTFKLPQLPWAPDALAPVISARTLEFHHGQHHKAYVDTANKLVEGRADLAGKSVIEIVRAVAGKAADQALFNAASQVWNHDFQWNSLASAKQRPSGPLADMIKKDFGDYEKFASEFAAAGIKQFGSGWAWLTTDGKALQIKTTANADSPAARGERCLLTIDVWEHAYYLDHQNRRKAYLDAVIDQRLNWAFASDNLRAKQ